MRLPKLTKLELQIMEVLWTRGPSPIREIQEAFPKRGRPAYTTIQTTVYRLEAKKTLRRVKKIGHGGSGLSNRRDGIGPMHLIEIDDVGLQTPQRILLALESSSSRV